MNLGAWIFVALCLVLFSGFGVMEISIRSIRDKESIPRAKRIAKVGWVIILIALVGIALHMTIFIYVNNIPTPWWP